MWNAPRPVVFVLAGGLTTAVAIAGSMNTAAQGRLAALPATVPAPADNPTTPDRVALGRLLFWDPVLSGPKDVACATCHHPSFGYADGLDLSIGINGAGLGTARAFVPGGPVRPVKRNSQTVLNTAFNGITAAGEVNPGNAPMFWDMRVRSLEAQALEPIKALEEMRGDTYPEARAISTIVARLDGIPDYRRLFARAFGGTQPVSERNLGRALAAFQRTLVAANSPFDRYMRGDTSAMTAEQISGMDRFEAIGCVNCHNGPMLSDFEPHVLSVPDNSRLAESDTGVNKTHAFRTPSLRNLGATAPYMHNGVFRSLPDVIAFYRRIGRGGGDRIDPLVRQLNMRGRGQPDIVAFLRALDDTQFDRTIPAQVPSGLAVGGRLQ